MCPRSCIPHFFLLLPVFNIQLGPLYLSVRDAGIEALAIVCKMFGMAYVIDKLLLEIQ